MPPSAIMVLASPWRSLVAMMTLAPCSWARIAAEVPAPPPPMIRTSVSYAGLARSILSGCDAAGGLEHVGDLVRDAVALGRTDLEFAPPLFLEVGVELEAFLALVEAQERDFFAFFLRSTRSARVASTFLMSSLSSGV